MNISTFVYQNHLRPADVVVVKKAGIGVLDHYLVYMGRDHYGRHWFMANLFGGVRWLSGDQIRRRSNEFTPKRIRRFEGTERQRQKALDRAESREGETYHLIADNCEHFANYVQHGRHYSQQVQNVGTGLGVLAIGVGLTLLIDLLLSDSNHRRRA